MPVCAEPAQRARRAAWRALTPRGANTHSLPPSGPPVAHRRLRTRAGGRRGRACCLRGRTCRAILRRRRPPPARWALREGARRRGDGRASQAARAGRRCAAAPRGRHASLSSRQHTAAPLLGASAPRRPACCCMWRGATEAGPRASACGALRAAGEPHCVPQSGQSAAVLCVVTRLSPGRVRASHLAPLLRWTLIEASYRPAEDETLPCSERAAIGKVRESHCTRCVASLADARFRAFLAHFPYLSKRWQRPLHPPLLRLAPLLRPPQRLLLWAAAMRSPAVSTPPFWKRCLPSCELR